MASKRDTERGIAAIKADPALFRRALIIDADGEERELGPSLDPWQRKDFEALDDAWRAVAGQKIDVKYRRAWIERPRGHSKTSDIAAMASYALFAAPRRIAGAVVAADKDQAALLKDAVSKLCQLNSWLGAVLDVQKERILNRLTDSELKVIPADGPSSYGLLLDFAILDETTHWQKQDLWDSLFSTAAKRKNCLLVSIANAGFIDSWAWAIREAVRVDPLWYFHSLDGPQASWLTEDRLAEQRRLLPPLAFDRLWGNRWSAGSGDAIPEDQIAAACTLAAPPAGPERGWAYFAGVDVGLKRDSSAIVVIGKHIGFRDEHRPPPLDIGSLPVATRLALTEGEISEYTLTDFRKLPSNEDELKSEEGTGRLRLAAIRVFRPEQFGGTVSINAVEQALLDLHSRFSFAAVGCDPWEFRGSVERLQDTLPIEIVTSGGQNQKSMCEAMLTAFAERQIELWPDATLVADLRHLRIEERHYGIRLVSPKNAGGATTNHGDSTSGLSIALHVAKKFNWLGSSRTYHGPLVAELI
jgi:hypothetical protein